MFKDNRMFCNVLGLRLIIIGKAECNWSRFERYGGHDRRVHYFGKQIHLNYVIYLFGSPQGDSIEIPAGAHAYNFEFLLPESLPYSIEGRKGFVRYIAEATLDIPWGFDYESRRVIQVVRYDDLNLVQSPNYREPYAVQEFKTFGCLCWKTKPLYITVRVPKTGFGLGEMIPIFVQMVNNSTNTVRATELRLIRVDQFISNSPPSSKTYSSVVTFKSAKGVAAGETANLEEFLEIPQILPTSNSRFCRIFQVKYLINFKARTSGFTEPPHDMNIAISIGNVGILMEPSPLVLASVLPQVQPVFLPAPVLPSAPLFPDDLRKWNNTEKNQA